jgi:hypothetical protein
VGRIFFKLLFGVNFGELVVDGDFPFSSMEADDRDFGDPLCDNGGVLVPKMSLELVLGESIGDPTLGEDDFGDSLGETGGDNEGNSIIYNRYICF